MTDPANQLIDGFGRVHTSLRLSVTDRCNIRCSYCMPSEFVRFLPRPGILSFEELTRVARVFAGLGVDKIRLTGGEPLVRRDLHLLIRSLRGIDSVAEIALTTNATLLADQAGLLKQSGLDRINVSLDTLDPRQFRQITRRDGLQAALDGIAAAAAAGFRGTSINAVAVRGLIESQIVPLTRFALDHELTLRFIEFMPLNAEGDWTDASVLSGEEIRTVIEGRFGPLVPAPRPDPSRPAVDYRFAGGSGTIGFVNSVSQPFCQACNRLRITADGKIRNCLFSHQEWDLRERLRSGAADEELRAAIRQCVAAKKQAHGIGSAEFAKPARAMYQIGG